MAAELIQTNGKYKLYFNPDIRGLKIVANTNDAEYAAFLTIYDNVTAYVNVPCKKGDYAYLTGYYYLYSSGVYKDQNGNYTSDVALYYQTTFGGYCVEPSTENPVWSGTNERKKLKSETQYETEAQRLVNKIIKNNIQIVQNNLVCARYANKFTTKQQDQIRELQERVQNRQEFIQKQGLCKDIGTSYPKGYADLEGYLDALMKGEAIGIATWVVVVIAATVIAGLGTAAYFAYKSFADESEKDVKYSKELTAVLTEKLTPEEYQQLLDETKGIVTKSRLKQAIGSYGRVLWIVGVAVAGAFAYKFLRNRFNG